MHDNFALTTENLRLKLRFQFIKQLNLADIFKKELNFRAKFYEPRTTIYEPEWTQPTLWYTST